MVLELFLLLCDNHSVRSHRNMKNLTISLTTKLGLFMKLVAHNLIKF